MFPTHLTTRFAGLALALFVVLASAPWRADAAVAGCESTTTDRYQDYYRPGWNELADYPDGRQKMIIASDPQAFRHMRQRVSEYLEDIEPAGWYRTASVYRAIARERDEPYHVPVVINGDITEYGHGNERAAVQSMLRKMAVGVGGPLMLPGLGNHDYKNNVDDCANNGCARDAVCDHIAWVQAMQPVNAFDYSFENDTHHGSLSYSVTVGRVRIIQLNHEPTYERQWSTGGGFSMRQKRHFSITRSVGWLEGQLQEAASNGETVIVNMHDSEDWSDEWMRYREFPALLEAYGVAAVFSGHTHWYVGRDYDGFASVPNFKSGALNAGTYLRLTFDWPARQLLVDEVSMDGHFDQTHVVELTGDGN
ncbi:MULTISPECIES: metallophosphoesterase [unclassified Pseudomonas]|uniref:metallophosphoesterase family protein n=1 Tax=unclassified Pseudomonas TaxID=196821 RepID=UPI00244BBB08|nr:MULTISPECIES: metallophosphoesterase [unclassified Pseudomonas]MDH0304821.1 metallophosphoesterase [Pseudomonas sp. GD04091]MDH1986997.1 metallophosphoesterase [Pseudomonas sp. GD03689]